MNNENQYLPEDKDIIDQLKNLRLSSGPIQEVIGDIQIKSILRQRKTMVDLDKSNKKYTHALGIFALLQIIIAGLQLVLDIKSPQDNVFSVFIGILFIIILIWFTKEFKSIK